MHTDRGSIALSVAAGAFVMISLTAPSVAAAAETGAVDRIPESRPQVDAPTDSLSVTCKMLKDDLERAGSLPILSGPKGWPDTFYGPRVPQCQFWARPVFTYVNARDGLCGVGYICVEKFGSAGGSR
jgi:hypothetical protein